MKLKDLLTSDIPKLSDLLIPYGLVNDRHKKTYFEDKIDTFVRLFGVDPDYNGLTTYDENGCANTPFYVGDTLKKDEIRKTLIDNGIISDDWLGKIQTELLLHIGFPDKSYTGYTFKKVKKEGNDTRYHLEWCDFIGVC